MNTLAIIVTYNGLRWLDRCLGSLRDAAGQVRSVVIDNGSTDGTPEAVRARFPEVELVCTGKNLGFGQANNIGLRMALERKVDHVFLLNQDAWVEPGTVEHLTRMSTARPQFGVLSPMHLNGAGDALEVIFSNYIVPQKCPGLYSDIYMGTVKDEPYPVKFVNAAAWLITRRCLLTVGGFDPTFFHYGEDTNYAARMDHHGQLIGVVPTVRVHHDPQEAIRAPFFNGKDIIDARRLALVYADPRRDRSLPLALRITRMNMVKNWITGQWVRAREDQRMLRLLRTSGLDIAMRNRMISKKLGPSFLE